jgi:adenosylcobinamide-GDP ribazoletransferase
MQLSSDEPSRPRPTNDNGLPALPVRFGDDLLMALRFYSRLPTGSSAHQRPDLNRIAIVLPLASFAIGLVPVAVLLILEWVGVPTFFAAAFAVGVLVLVTGAMSEDALADAADGLFGGDTIERRLEIMKDSRHGTYAVCALGLFLILRIVAVGSISAPFEAAALLLTAPLIARSGALWLTHALPAARSGGAAAAAGHVSPRNFVIGMAITVIVTFATAGFAVGVLGLLVAYALCAGVALGWVVLCRRLVGGQTGDLIGALQALLEIAALTAFMVFV